MTKNNNETRSVSYLIWSRWVAIALVIVLAFMWLMGFGPLRANCCGASPASTPASVAITVPAAVVATLASVPVTASAAATKPDVCSGAVTKADISFETGSTALSLKGKAVLDTIVVECLIRQGANVTGHTDNVGSVAGNQRLSEQRAQAVVSYLKTKGVPADKLTARGAGDKESIADNTTVAGRSTNRRMVIQLNP